MKTFLELAEFNDFFDALPDALLIVDEKRIIQNANKKALLFFGYEVKELIGNRIDCLIPLPVRSLHEAKMKEYFRRPQMKKMAPFRKVAGVHKDGRLFDLDVALAPLQLEGGMFVIASCRDIREIVHQEEALRNENQILGLVNQKLEQYNYTVSHDLKAPLSNLNGLIDMLMQEMAKVRPSPAMLDISFYIRQVSQSMTRMIKDILEEARRAYDVDEEETLTLHDIWDDLQKLIVIPSHCHCVIRDEGGLVSGKRIQLLQVFLNLLDNAIKYNDKSEGLIELSCQQIPEGWVFQVKDNGRGIPPDRLLTIFDLFSKGSLAYDTLSYGIGLYTVHSIVTARHGRIEVESEQGKGTTFKIFWPVSYLPSRKANTEQKRQEEGRHE